MAPRNDVEVCVLDKEKDVVVFIDMEGPAKLSDLARGAINVKSLGAKVHNWSNTYSRYHRASADNFATLPQESRQVVQEECRVYYETTSEGVLSVIALEEYHRALQDNMGTTHCSPKRMRELGYREVIIYKFKEVPTHLHFDIRYKNPELLPTAIYRSGLDEEIVVGSYTHLDKNILFLRHFQIKVHL